MSLARGGRRTNTSTIIKEAAASNPDPVASFKKRMSGLLRPRDGDEKNQHPSGVDEHPGCVYEVVTRTMLEGLAKDVEEVKSRVNALLWGVGGAVLLDVIMRVGGR